MNSKWTPEEVARFLHEGKRLIREAAEKEAALREELAQIRGQLHKSRRERIATAALQGLLACPDGHNTATPAAKYAAAACKCADALIAVLDAKTC